MPETFILLKNLPLVMNVWVLIFSDDDFELPVISKAAQKEINQQLIKDGYNLDLEPDDEDLDLIPPRPVHERCTCCNYYTGNCAVQ